MTQDCRNCELSEWSEWGQCERVNPRTYIRRRTRTVAVEPMNGGRECTQPYSEYMVPEGPSYVHPSRLTQQQDCQDCKQTDWVYGACEDDGVLVKTRTTLQTAKNGGVPCGEEVEEEPCQNCVLGEWEDYSVCEDGKRERRRIVVTEPSEHGKKCDNPPDVQECGDCRMTRWENVGECKDGRIQQKRRVAKEPFNGGKACEDLERTVSCKQDCELEEWSEWECGDDGVAQRHRKIATVPYYGGKACDPKSKSAVFNGVDRFVESKEGCAKCELGDWGSWGACEEDGKQRRTKIVQQEPHLAPACDNPVEERDCVRDCEMTEWSDYGACEGGKATRTRTIEVTPANGGEACGETKESMACIEHSAVENGSCQHPAESVPIQDLIDEAEPRLFLASSECGKDSTRLVAREGDGGEWTEEYGNIEEAHEATGISVRAIAEYLLEGKGQPNVHGDWQFSRPTQSQSVPREAIYDKTGDNASLLVPAGLTANLLYRPIKKNAPRSKVWNEDRIRRLGMAVQTKYGERTLEEGCHDLSNIVPGTELRLTVRKEEPSREAEHACAKYCWDEHGMNVSSIDHETCACCSDGLGFSHVEKDESRLMRAEKKDRHPSIRVYRSRKCLDPAFTVRVVRDGKRAPDPTNDWDQRECARLCKEEGKNTSMMDKKGNCSCCNSDDLCLLPNFDTRVDRCVAHTDEEVCKRQTLNKCKWDEARCENKDKWKHSVFTINDEDRETCRKPDCVMSAWEYTPCVGADPLIIERSENVLPSHESWGKEKYAYKTEISLSGIADKNSKVVFDYFDQNKTVDADDKGNFSTMVTMCFHNTGTCVYDESYRDIYGRDSAASHESDCEGKGKWAQDCDFVMPEYESGKQADYISVRRESPDPNGYHRVATREIDTKKPLLGGKACPETDDNGVETKIEPCQDCKVGIGYRSEPWGPCTNSGVGNEGWTSRIVPYDVEQPQKNGGRSCKTYIESNLQNYSWVGEGRVRESETCAIEMTQDGKCVGFVPGVKRCEKNKWNVNCMGTHCIWLSTAEHERLEKSRADRAARETEQQMKARVWLDVGKAFVENNPGYTLPDWGNEHAEMCPVPQVPRSVVRRANRDALEQYFENQSIEILDTSGDFVRGGRCNTMNIIPMTWGQENSVTLKDLAWGCAKSCAGQKRTWLYRPTNVSEVVVYMDGGMDPKVDCGCCAEDGANRKDYKGSDVMSAVTTVSVPEGDLSPWEEKTKTLLDNFASTYATEKAAWENEQEELKSRIDVENDLREINKLANTCQRYENNSALKCKDPCVWDALKGACSAPEWVGVTPTVIDDAYYQDYIKGDTPPVILQRIATNAQPGVVVQKWFREKNKSKLYPYFTESDYQICSRYIPHKDKELRHLQLSRAYRENKRTSGDTAMSCREQCSADENCDIVHHNSTAQQSWCTFINCAGYVEGMGKPRVMWPDSFDERVNVATELGSVPNTSSDFKNWAAYSAIEKKHGRNSVWALRDFFTFETEPTTRDSRGINDLVLDVSGRDDRYYNIDESAITNGNAKYHALLRNPSVTLDDYCSLTVTGVNKNKRFKKTDPIDFKMILHKANCNAGGTWKGQLTTEQCAKTCAEDNKTIFLYDAPDYDPRSEDVYDCDKCNIEIPTWITKYPDTYVTLDTYFPGWEKHVDLDLIEECENKCKLKDVQVFENETRQWFTAQQFVTETMNGGCWCENTSNCASPMKKEDKGIHTLKHLKGYVCDKKFNVFKIFNPDQLLTKTYPVNSNSGRGYWNLDEFENITEIRVNGEKGYEKGKTACAVDMYNSRNGQNRVYRFAEASTHNYGSIRWDDCEETIDGHFHWYTPEFRGRSIGHFGTAKSARVWFSPPGRWRGFRDMVQRSNARQLVGMPPFTSEKNTSCKNKTMKMNIYLPYEHMFAGSASEQCYSACADDGKTSATLNKFRKIGGSSSRGKFQCYCCDGGDAKDSVKMGGWTLLKKNKDIYKMDNDDRNQLRKFVAYHDLKEKYAPQDITLTDEEKSLPWQGQQDDRSDCAKQCFENKNCNAAILDGTTCRLRNYQVKNGCSLPSKNVRSKRQGNPVLVYTKENTNKEQGSHMCCIPKTTSNKYNSDVYFDDATPSSTSDSPSRTYKCSVFARAGSQRCEDEDNCIDENRCAALCATSDTCKGYTYTPLRPSMHKRTVCKLYSYDDYAGAARIKTREGEDLTLGAMQWLGFRSRNNACKDPCSFLQLSQNEISKLETEKTILENKLRETQALWDSTNNKPHPVFSQAFRKDLYENGLSLTQGLRDALQRTKGDASKVGPVYSLKFMQQKYNYEGSTFDTTRMDEITNERLAVEADIDKIDKQLRAQCKHEWEDNEGNEEQWGKYMTRDFSDKNTFKTCKDSCNNDETCTMFSFEGSTCTKFACSDFDRFATDYNLRGKYFMKESVANNFEAIRENRKREKDDYCGSLNFKDMDPKDIDEMCNNVGCTQTKMDTTMMNETTNICHGKTEQRVTAEPIKNTCGHFTSEAMKSPNRCRVFKSECEWNSATKKCTVQLARKPVLKESEEYKAHRRIININ